MKYAEMNCRDIHQEYHLLKKKNMSTALCEYSLLNISTRKCLSQNNVGENGSGSWCGVVKHVSDCRSVKSLPFVW